LAALDLGAGVELSFGCLIEPSGRPEVSGHAVRGEVNGLDIGGQHGRWFVLLRHTHRPQKEAIPRLYKHERKRPTLGRRPDAGSSWEGHSRGVGDGVGDESAEACVTVCPLRIPLVIRTLRHMHVVVIR